MNNSRNHTAEPSRPGVHPLCDAVRRDLTGRRATGRGFAAVGLVIACWAVLAGCGYMVGNAHRPDIRTVHVPLFESDADRRGFEFQLTEAVQKEIQQRTAFRLVKEPMADTRLRGRIIDISKRPLTESAFDDPRELQLSFAVQVAWEDLDTNRILAQQNIPLEPQFISLSSQSEFAPEVGQSLATGTQAAIDRLARQIVDMMEAPW